MDGELVALPVVLGGLLLLQKPTLAAWGSAGALGMAAVLVKQNFADVLIVGAVLLVAEMAMRRCEWREVARRGPALGLGAMAMLVVVLSVAVLAGTTPSGLWDAVVLFRLQATQVIAASASPSTSWRLGRLLLVLVVTGTALVVALVLVRAARKPRSPWAMAAGVLAAWELFGAFAGGSYWLHYLVGLVPSLAVGAGLLASRPGRAPSLLRAAAVLAVASTAVTSLWGVVLGPPDNGEEKAVAMGRWLGATAEPDDSAAVLFGEPNILRVAGLDSPHPQLWSLPVRVRDPDLEELTTVLEGRDAPTWLVITGRGIATWGVDSQGADAVAREHYRLVGRFCGFTVALRIGLERDAAPLPKCAT